MDSTADDYERNSWREYIMGRGPVEPNLPPPQVRVVNSKQNDPRVGDPLDTANLDKSPVYIRFEPTGSSPDWNLRVVFALVYTGEGHFVKAFTAPLLLTSADLDLWFGDNYGKILYLTEEILDSGRAAREFKTDQ